MCANECTYKYKYKVPVYTHKIFTLKTTNHCKIKDNAYS